MPDSIALMNTRNIVIWLPRWFQAPSTLIWSFISRGSTLMLCKWHFSTLGILHPHLGYLCIDTLNDVFFTEINSDNKGQESRCTQVDGLKILLRWTKINLITSNEWPELKQHTSLRFALHFCICVPSVWTSTMFSVSFIKILFFIWRMMCILNRWGTI